MEITVDPDDLKVHRRVGAGVSREMAMTERTHLVNNVPITLAPTTWAERS